MLSHAIGGGVSPSRCVAVNTDRGQLSRSPARNKVFLADSVGSTSSNVVVGRDDQKVFQSAAHRVTSYTDGSDFTIVVTGLGGETGTQSAPIIAQRSRTPVRPVVSVVAIPFIHERERRFIALRGLKKMVEACDCTIVIDNGVNRDYLSTSKRTTDETASIAVRSLTELLSGAEDVEARDILQVLSRGNLATVCNFSLRTGDTLQTSVIEALRGSVAPLSRTSHPQHCPVRSSIRHAGFHRRIKCILRTRKRLQPVRAFRMSLSDRLHLRDCAKRVHRLHRIIRCGIRSRRRRGVHDTLSATVSNGASSSPKGLVFLALTMEHFSNSLGCPDWTADRGY